MWRQNDLKVQELIAVDPALRQIVNFSTNKNLDKTLDVVCTDLFASYQEPTRLPAIGVDHGKEGVPSDHWGVEVRPRTNTTTTKARPKKETILVRRMPDSQVSDFGQKLVQEKWRCLEDGASTEELVEAFQAATTRLIDQHFPMKQVTIIEGDLPYFTEELRELRRTRDRSYQRCGKGQTYIEIQEMFQWKLKNEASKYRNKIINDVSEGKRGSGYKAIRKLGEGSADRDQRREFTIPSYVAEGLSPQQAADRLASHFSAISQTVPPLDVSKFHPALRQAINHGRTTGDKPTLTQHDVYRKLIKIKKPNSAVEGDIPRKLILEFPFLWAGPAAKIFNSIIRNTHWPQLWKTESMIVLHKTEHQSLVKNEDDVRSISKTNFLSKVLESLLGNWLIPMVDPYLDPGQCGGLARSSINHYLIKLLDFIHTNQDQVIPHAVVLAALDLSKAYNRGDSMVIQDLFDMHVPGWLLALLCSYLSTRKMVLRYQKTNSTVRDLPGGYGLVLGKGDFCL